MTLDPQVARDALREPDTALIDSRSKKQYGIPKTLELVRSQRGAEGGYWLARPADQITIADIIRAVEGPLAHIRGERADASALFQAGFKGPEEVVLKAADGKTDLYGMMFVPSNLDRTKKYPIINNAYPGPQSGSVGSRAFTAARGDKQALAELGFVVVSIDGTGTPNRSKAYTDAYYGAMGRHNTIPDQIAGMKELAKKYPWIDIDKAAMWGHSGGGFATASAMFRAPDFFKVGISESGNHDNRVYVVNDEIWQTGEGLVAARGILDDLRLLNSLAGYAAPAMRVGHDLRLDVSGPEDRALELAVNGDAGARTITVPAGQRAEVLSSLLYLAALLLDVLGGPTPGDHEGVARPDLPFTQAALTPPRPLRIAWWSHPWSGDEPDPEVTQATAATAALLESHWPLETLLESLTTEPAKNQLV